MARAEDGPTTVTPKALLLAAVILLVARVAVSGYELSHKTKVTPEVAWAEVQDSDLLFSGEEAPRKVEPKPDIEWKDVQEPGQWDVSSKPKLLKFYASWSEPCKRMESTVFVNKNVASLINSHFRALSIRDTLKEEGSNAEYVTRLQKKYRVFAFPTLVVVMPDGEPVATLVGCSSALATQRFLARLAPTRRGLY